MLRTALIALALSLALAACVSEHTQNPLAQNPPCADCPPPDAIMCAAPGAPHGWIAVPAGKKPTDVCPPNFIGDRLVHLPLAATIAAPVEWPRGNETMGHPP